MATFSLALDKRRAKQDGTYNLVFRITQFMKFKDITTSYSIKSDDFNIVTSTIHQQPNIQSAASRTKHTLFNIKYYFSLYSGQENYSIDNSKIKLKLLSILRKNGNRIHIKVICKI